jgi:cardiolipin synthase
MTIVPSEIEPAWYALEWIIRIGALAMVPLRRTPAATRSWLLLIFFLPVPGLLLFMVIGSPRFPHARKARFEALKPFIADVAARIGATGSTGCRGSEPIAELAQKLAESGRRNPETEVQLRADRAVPYGRVVEVMGAAQQAGLNRIGFVAEPVGATKVQK